jgi:hypothetical protein
VNPTPHTISAISDISANIFALLIFILIIMVVAKGHAPASRVDAPQTIDLEKDIVGTERAPLGSDELFELLYDRSEATASVKIDLFEREIDVVSGGEIERFASIESAVPRLRQIAAAARRPIGVYVFGHHFYRNVTDSLKMFGLQWREVSVPQALRDFRTQRNGQGWSEGFSRLIAQPSNRAWFRAELARLLQSSSTDEKSGQNWFDGSNVSSQPQETMIDSVVRWSRTVANAMAIFGGFIFVSWVETRRGR